MIDHNKHDYASPGDARILFDGGAYIISGISCVPETPLGIHPPPLIVAIHGGTYNSGYFDVAGYSLIQRAAGLGIPILALDRPVTLGGHHHPQCRTTELCHWRNLAEIRNTSAGHRSHRTFNWRCNCHCHGFAPAALASPRNRNLRRRPDVATRGRRSVVVASESIHDRFANANEGCSDVRTRMDL